MLEAITVGISIDRDWRDLYESIWRPEAFPSWASGLSKASLVRQGEIWTAEGPEGPIQIRFTGQNGFGVMDHWVDLGGGRVVYVPLRIVANGTGAQVLLTLFRQPDMSEVKFAHHQDWVKRDLLALKALAER
jgi:hypothetical protein